MNEDSRRHREAAVEDFDLFSMAFSSAAIGMALVATDGRFLNVNDAMCRITGYSRSDLLARDFQSITHPGDVDADVEQARELLAGDRASYRMEKRYIRKDGSIAWVLLTGSLARTPSGEPRVFIAQVQDLGDQKRAESELAAFFELCSDPLAIASPEAVLVRVNPAWQDLLGWSTAELEGRPVAAFLHPDDVEATAAEFGRIAEQGGSANRWFNRYRHKDGSYRWLEWTTSIRPDGCFLGVARDITRQRESDEQLKQQSRQLEDSNRRLSRALSSLQQVNRDLEAARDELEFLAWHDALTGLGNRNGFLSRLERDIAVCAGDDKEFALLFMDLDGFKAVNDSLGHAAGDTVLQEVASRLQKVLGGTDEIFRVGGDEFAALLVPANDDLRDRAKTMARRILHALDNPVHAKGEDFLIGSSIGIALYPVHGRDSDTLVRNADSAMYEAKGGGDAISFASDLGATTTFRNLPGRLMQD